MAAEEVVEVEVEAVENHPNRRPLPSGCCDYLQGHKPSSFANPMQGRPTLPTAPNAPRHHNYTSPSPKHFQEAPRRRQLQKDPRLAALADSACNSSPLFFQEKNITGLLSIAFIAPA